MKIIPYCVFFIFFISSIMKAWYVGNFTTEVAYITFIPQSIKIVLPILVPVCEMILAGILLHTSTRTIAMYISAVAFLGFILYFIWRGASGIHTPCSCLGITLETKYNNSVGIGKNLLFEIMTLYWIIFSRNQHKTVG